jgi:tRNA1(Val) A37 N6-methylase TrmN6
MDDFPYYNLIKDDKVLEARIGRLSAYNFDGIIHRTVVPYEVSNMRNVLGPLDYVFVPSLAFGPNIGASFRPLAAKADIGPKACMQGPTAGFYFIENRPGDYAAYNMISCYFQDKIIVRTRRRDSISTFDIWNRDKKAIIEYALSRKLVPASIVFRPDMSSYLADPAYISGAREAIYAYTIEVLRSAEVTTFRPALAVGFAKEFYADPGAITVLDICSGWGDRMVGFMAAGVAEYIGVDPNADLVPGYTAIEAAMRSALGCKTHVQMITAPFEDAILPSKHTGLGKSISDGPWRADLIFTSPPYFDLELYSEAKDQSLVKNEGSFERWFDKFLMTSLRKAWTCLRPGGFMCININNYIDFAAKTGGYKHAQAKGKHIGSSQQVFKPHQHDQHVFGPDYTYRMVTEINRCLGGQCGGAVYCGPLLFCELRAKADTSSATVHKAAQVIEPGRPQPIWVWRRTMTDILSAVDGKTMLQRPAADELLSLMPPLVNKVTAISVAQNMTGAEVPVMEYTRADVDKILARADFATLRGLGIKFKLKK